MGLLGLFQSKNVVDPVCGMKVPRKGGAFSQDYEGRTFVFCSVNCMGTFRADPQKYAP